MKRITINRIKIANFKGLKDFELDVGGNNAAIGAENGVGKTSVYDAFLWLLFDKDSSGRAQFGLRPVNSQNEPIKGLVVSVEAELDCGGTVRVFRKEQHEKVLKKQLRGYETLCWINLVPKKVKEYELAIAELIDEDTFKLLTDLSYFNEKMHWTERRGVLLDIAGDIGTPGGFEELLAALNGRSMDEYKKVLVEQKKRYVKERDEINPRIDELQRGLDSYAGGDTKDLEVKRHNLDMEIKEIEKGRKSILAEENIRQVKIERLNNLKARRSEREVELKNDTSAIVGLLDQKAALETGVAEKKAAVTTAQTAYGAADSVLKSANARLAGSTKELQEVRAQFKAVEADKDPATCYACGQGLPAEKIAEMQQQRKAKLDEISARGKDLKCSVVAQKKTIEKFEAELKEAGEALAAAEDALIEADKAKDAELANIEKQIAACPSTPPDKDPKWKRLSKSIEDLEVEIGEPVSERLDALENDRIAKNSELSEINAALGQSDRMKQDAARIKELEQKEKDLAQKLAEIEGQLADIDQYKATESGLIEQAVNGRFRVTEWKLFERLLNGGFDECCEATYHGVPYRDMSTGQKIICGVDIVNTLSEHYGLSVPLFVDHAESVTMSLEAANSQTIELWAVQGVTELDVEIKEVANV